MRRSALEPWRDTGVEIRGPAVAEIERAFAQVWDACGGTPLGRRVADAARRRSTAAGDAALRVVAGAPSARQPVPPRHVDRRRWRGSTCGSPTPISSAAATYTQALRAAARDGVDVRLLVPGASDIPALRPLSRVGYRPLLEAGVRVFEWNGTMLHAKTAVADGEWARVGSTNLNLASFIGNWELDVAIEDAGFAATMAAHVRGRPAPRDRDRADAPEPRAHGRRRPRPSDGSRRALSGSAGRAAAGALSRRQRGRRRADQPPAARARGSGAAVAAGGIHGGRRGAGPAVSCASSRIRWPSCSAGSP